MAVATVSGWSIRWPMTSGAAPAAWKPHIRGVAGHHPGGRVVAEAHPVGADVAGVADRDGQHVRRATEVVADLEGGGLLALEAERVDRVDQGHRVVFLFGERAHDRERLVEVAVDGDRPGRRRSAPGAACRWRSGPWAGPRSPPSRPPHRRPRRTPTCCRSRRRRRRWRPPRPPSRRPATMPRSLNEPVGFWPSTLRCRFGTPMAAPSRGAWTSGVSPSPSVSAGVASVTGRKRA